MNPRLQLGDGPDAPAFGPGPARKRCTLCGARAPAGRLAACGACPAAFCPACAADFALPAHRLTLFFPDGREVPLRADRCPADGALLVSAEPGPALRPLAEADRRLGAFLARRRQPSAGPVRGGFMTPPPPPRQAPSNALPASPGLTGFRECDWRAAELLAWAGLSGWGDVPARAALLLFRRVLEGRDPGRWLARLDGRGALEGVPAPAVCAAAMCLLRLVEDDPRGSVAPWREATALASSVLARPGPDAAGPRDDTGAGSPA